MNGNKLLIISVIALILSLSMAELIRGVYHGKIWFSREGRRLSGRDHRGTAEVGR